MTLWLLHWTCGLWEGISVCDPSTWVSLSELALTGRFWSILCLLLTRPLDNCLVFSFYRERQQFELFSHKSGFTVPMSCSSTATRRITMSTAKARAWIKVTTIYVKFISSPVDGSSNLTFLISTIVVWRFPTWGTCPSTACTSSNFHCRMTQCSTIAEAGRDSDVRANFTGRSLRVRGIFAHSRTAVTLVQLLKVWPLAHYFGLGSLTIIFLAIALTAICIVPLSSSLAYLSHSGSVSHVSSKLGLQSCADPFPSEEYCVFSLYLPPGPCRDSYSQVSAGF